MIQKLIRAALRSGPHEIHLAPDGSTGLAMVKKERPDVIFSDVSMPVMDGYQLGDAIQSDPELRHIPIVFMTASVQRSQLEEASRHGAASVLAKPFTMADLRARVDQFTTKAG
jgi:CheY-like chemotaxis protein